MAVPEEATKLGTVGIAYKGVYNELESYKYANAVYHNGSTYIALIDNPAGFPSNDGVNWRYLAQGFLQQAISALTVIDESGILGEVDAEVNAQEFLSKIAELEQGLEDTKANKSDILDSLQEVIANTEEGRIAGANAVGELNSKLSHIGMIIHTTTLDTEDKVKEIYGGTSWVKIEGRFLLGQSSSYAINSTGGEATHTLTIAEMPSHNHAGKISARGSYLAFYNDGTVGSSGTASYNSTGDTFSLTSNGGNQSHNNMPPYKTVYIWERTA